jgi:hypothetical protein
MTITEDDLVESLSEMHILLHLFIQDVPCSGVGETDHTLITDSLLRRLTYTHDATSLIPHLSSLHVVTLFTFDTDLLPDLITSRIFPGDREGRFEMAVGWMNNREPAMEASIVTRIRKLNCGGKANYAGVSNDCGFV